MYGLCDLLQISLRSNQPFISFSEVIQNIVYFSLNLDPTQPKLNGLEC